MDYGTLVNISDRVLVSPRNIEQMLFILRGGSKKQIELQRELGLPSSAMRVLPFELSDLVDRHGDRFSLKTGSESAIDELHARRVSTDAQFNGSMLIAGEELSLIEQTRDRSNRGFDQFRAMPESTIAKVILMYGQGELEGRSILLMGDNDMVSAVIGFTGLAKRITVLDIDKTLLKLLYDINQRYIMQIEAVHYNAKRILPADLKSKYDVAVTDPPFTPGGIGLFVSRCLSALIRQNGVVYLSYGYSPRAAERALPIQNVLTQMGLVLEEVKHDFTRYFAAQSIGSTSNLYVCRLTPRAKPIVSGEFVGDIYTRTRPK